MLKIRRIENINSSTGKRGVCRSGRNSNPVYVLAMRRVQTVFNLFDRYRKRSYNNLYNRQISRVHRFRNKIYHTPSSFPITPIDRTPVAVLCVSADSVAEYLRLIGDRRDGGYDSRVGEFAWHGAYRYASSGGL